MEKIKAIEKDRHRAKKIIRIIVVVNLIILCCLIILMIKIDIKNPVLDWLPFAISLPVSMPPIFLMYFLINTRKIFKKGDLENLEAIDLILLLPNYKKWVEDNNEH